MEIRKIEEKDLLACIKLLKDAYSFPPYNESFKENTAELYIKSKYDVCKENSFVFNKEDDVIAFAFISMSCWSDGNQAVLEEIVVAPDYQNQGFGTKLLNFIDNYLKELNVKSIMIWAKNDDRLLKFYKKHNYYLADDFVIMFKNIKK